jgi:hypothetical protein
VFAARQSVQRRLQAIVPDKPASLAQPASWNVSNFAQAAKRIAGVARSQPVSALPSFMQRCRISEAETLFVVLRQSTDNNVADMLEPMSGIADKVSVFEIS